MLLLPEPVGSRAGGSGGDTQPLGLAADLAVPVRRGMSVGKVWEQDCIDAND